jgi:hypothetical protein
MSLDRKKCKVLLTFCFLIWFATSAQINVKQNHPNILLDSDSILKLPSKATVNTIKWQQLQNSLSEALNHSSQYNMNQYAGEQYCFMYALSFYAAGNTVHRDSAVSMFKYFNRDEA